MKVKNITLVITDPCYIKHSACTKFIDENTIYGDWSCMCYKCDAEEAKKKASKWDKIYFEFFRKYNSINNSTESNKAEKKKIYEEFVAIKNKFIKDNCYGEFCADSGRVAVYDYNRLDVKDQNWIREHSWCACVIPDYTGEFNYVVETDNRGNKSAHIVGDSFYTTQSGL